MKLWPCKTDRCLFRDHPHFDPPILVGTVSYVHNNVLVELQKS